MNSYIGYTTIELSDEELAKFYETNMLDIANLIENHYYLIQQNNKIIDKVKYVNKEIQRLESSTIKTQQLGTIHARNIEQELAIDLLKTRQAKVKLIKGVYGSGKIFATA